jgi:predicted ATP-grasp superfamily ATP-dependent carboligase
VTAAPLKILLTEGSSTSARQAIFSLGPRHTLDLLDPSPFCQGRFSRFVRRRYTCPCYSREPAAYLSFLVDRLRSEPYDVLLPTHEQVFLLSRFRDELKQHTALALPSFESMDRLMSKARFSRLLDELNLPQPRTEIVHGRSDLLVRNEFPFYVKVPYSTAGEGVRLVNSASELCKAVDDFDRAGWVGDDREILVQTLATGVKRGVTGIFQEGVLVGAQCVESRATGVGGSSMAKISVLDDAAVEQMRHIGAHLAWHGAMCIEYFRDPQTGSLQLIECNPRIGETGSALLSGVNLCELLVQVSLGRPVLPAADAREGVKTHQGFLILMAMALNGCSRRQLVAELLRSWRGSGLYENSEDELTNVRKDWRSFFPAAGVALLLLARPRAAQWLVSTTVDNYSLHQSAVESIRTMQFDASTCD